MKKIIAGLVCGAVMLAGFIPAAFAVSSASVSMQATSDQAATTLNLSDSAQEVTAVSLSFQVNVTAGSSEKASVWFAFDSGLPANIQEYRYNAQTGRLTLYLSGKNALFQQDSTLLGSIKASTQDAAGLTVSVQPISDSLKLVNTSSEVMNAPAIDTGSVVQLVVGEGGENNAAKVDFTALANAVATAEAKNAAEYTTDSWNALQAALRSAKAVLAAADSTQESVDAATNALNAAIQGLVAAGGSSSGNSSGTGTAPTTPTTPTPGGVNTVTTPANNPAGAASSSANKKPASSGSSSSAASSSESKSEAPSSTSASSSAPASESTAPAQSGSNAEAAQAQPTGNIANTIMIGVIILLVIAIIGVGIAIVRKRR